MLRFRIPTEFGGFRSEVYKLTCESEAEFCDRLNFHDLANPNREVDGLIFTLRRDFKNRYLMKSPEVETQKTDFLHHRTLKVLDRLGDPDRSTES